ncbi:MAG TPA: thiol-disulfide isomerase [Terriglobia bacterium]|nr:thiol-disulfide isomerase [Terriglobia bacterium]
MRSLTLAAGLIVASLAAGTAVLTAQSPATPTFSRDVAPILYRNCVTCHRPGEIAPMSLVTYEQARPYARSIRERIELGTMPPWHAEAPAGTFLNERRLTAAEKQILARWADNAAPQGDPKDVPPAPVFTEGWAIGKPDAVVAMAEPYNVPASGTIDYQYFAVPTNFTEDKWVQAIEIRAGVRSVVHHVLVFASEPGAAFRDQPFVQRIAGAPGPVAQQLGPAVIAAVRNRLQTAASARGPLIATTAPGTNAIVFQPGAAMRIKAGSVLTLQVHYTATGKPEKDRSSVGFIFAKESPKQEIRSSSFINVQLAIPAGAGNHRVDSQIDFTQDAHIVALFPHTHLRGKSWEYRLTYPDGREEVLLSVPHYDFNWQTYYEFAKPIAVPKGSTLLAIAHYDNSANNKANPDPSAEVRWGDQTWQEMQYSGITYTVD